MSDASDADDVDDDIEAIKAQKKEELAARSERTEPVHVEGGDHLDELVADNDVVLVDFYADWCGPCQMMEPAIEAVATETRTAVAKVDVDDHQGLARQYNVQGVPTLYLFSDGERAERLVGMQDETALFELVDQYL